MGQTLNKDDDSRFKLTQAGMVGLSLTTWKKPAWGGKVVMAEKVCRRRQKVPWTLRQRWRDVPSDKLSKLITAPEHEFSERESSQYPYNKLSFLS